MATRRMFSKTITSSSAFLMMPNSSQNLYFQLGMNADDDGFCEHFSIMRMIEAKPDDLKILQAKGFVQVFDDKVLVITQWKENNYIQKDRYTPSKYLQIYKEEILQISMEGANVRLKFDLPEARIEAPVKKEVPPREIKPFNAEDTKQAWYDGKDEAFQLIAWYFDRKNLWPKFDSRAKLDATASRHLRAARQIVKAEWSQKECASAVRKMLDANPKMKDEWTLETLIKYLTK